MHRVIKTCVFTMTIAGLMLFIGSKPAQAEGWRWARPLNQKPGSAFYTSNRKLKSNSYSVRSGSSSRYSSRQTYTYRAAPRTRTIYRTRWFRR